MNVEGEQSETASDGESAEEEGEDSSEEDTEDGSGSDRHSDLDPDVGSEEESERPKREQRRAPGKRLASDGQEAREAARTELPYTFAGDTQSRFLGFGRTLSLAIACLAGAVRVEWGLMVPSGRVDTSCL